MIRGPGAGGTGLGHRRGVQHPVQCPGIHEVSLQHNYPQRAARRQGLLCDRRSHVISQVGIQRGHEHERTVDEFAGATGVGLEARQRTAP